MVRITASMTLIFVCQFGLCMQACQECTCCKNGSIACDSNKNCIDGCIAGRFGARCTEACPENCKNCVSGSNCTECVRGFYNNKCTLQCGKGCLDKTCLISSGECACKSTDFLKGKCDVCFDDNKYGDECNKTCPSNCGSCISETECTWCKHTIYYGSYCQYNCSVGCVYGRCDKGTGNCKNGCKSGFIGDKCDTCSPGKYGIYCDFNCTENCYSCISKTHCTECKSRLYGKTCTHPCPSGCDRNCSLNDGLCFGCKPGFVEEFCYNSCINKTYGVNCSISCHNKDTNCNDYKCDICSHGLYGKFCDLNCSENCYSCISKTNCTECTSGLYGKTCTHPCPSGCDRNCSLNDGLCFGCKLGFVEELCYNTCKNKTYGVNCSISCHNKDNNCYGCIDGYEGSTCVLAIEGSEGNKLQVIIVTSSGAGVAVIILLMILVICLVKRQKRRKLSTTRKCVENEYVQDMQEINKQHDADESAVIYAQPSKPKRPASDDSAHGDDNTISAFDNGYTMVNIGTSANDNNKSFEVCDSALDIKCHEVLSGNNEYAVVNKGKSAVKKNEGMEQIHDTTHDNKKKIHHLKSNTEYAVLSLRSDNVVGFGKTKGAEAAEGDDLYDTTEGGKHKTMPRPSNDYAVFKSNNADYHEAVKAKANTLNANYCREKTMQSVNNDYEFGSEDFE